MKLNNIKKLLCAFALVLTTNAHSGIMNLESRDYLFLGDGLITYDKSTGLEWLDVTFTAGLSMLEVEANSFIWAEGWDWVTTDQMETMFDYANDGNSFEQPTIAYPIVELLGPTSTVIVPGEKIRKAVSGYSRNFYVEPSTDPFEYATASIWSGINLDPSDPWYPYYPDDICSFGDEYGRCGDWFYRSWEETDTDSFKGAWLVRVPEPPAILLFGIGLIGLIGIRMRRKAA